MKIVEHTAQLDKKTAYEYQKAFVKKDIDILSCSTTFEMGVDVGSLETVFMRNMPPSPSNYAQRAGRAGRSSQSAAYALTFCNKSNHDFAYFQDPTRMIKGKINPPKFNVENDKIAIRHLFASSFSYFWKKDDNKIYFSNAKSLIEDGGAEKYKEYITSHPKQFKEFAKRFLPQSLVEKFDIENFGWVDKLLSKDEFDIGLLEKAIGEYNYEIDVLKAAQEEALENNPDEFSRLNKRIKVFQRESILAFLSRKNILPKYGFPVDTVELKISGSGGYGLQLQRDLEAAISEYAPGSQIVANGNLITSRYINKVPGMSWKQYLYKKCQMCQTLNVIPHVESVEDNLKECKQCKCSLEDVNSGVFLIPEFGFATEAGKMDKPKLIKPDRTYKNEISYISNKSSNFKEVKIGNSITELAINKGEEMAVLNTSNFFVCQECGYTHLDSKCFSTYKKKKHKRPSGYTCSNNGSNTLRRFSLGYRFETDVAQLRFIGSNLSNFEDAMCVLYGVLSGIYSELNIESSDVSGCLQYYFNEDLHQGNYAIILFDKTPGGAGFVKRLSEDGVLESVLYESLRLMKRCTCGGELGDSSCYSCLRSYYNQKHHDILKRSVVIDFIEDLLR